MRLIDVDKITITRQEYVGALTLKERLQRLLKFQPTVEAIPIEWLKNKISQYESATLSLRDRSYYKTNLGEVYVHSLTISEVERLNDLRRKSSCYSTILEEWEKENGLS